MSQQWPGTPVAQTGAGPQPVLTVPDTGKEQDRQRQDDAAGRDEERLQMARDADVRGQTDTRFRQEKDLRDGFDRNPEVVGYRSSLPMLSQALRAPKNGQGDISVIYAYAKLMDPTSVVRESEMDMVTGSSPWAQAKAQELQNQLDSSGRLPPNVRRSLEQEMIRTTRARRLAYDAQRERYIKNAQAYGLDPMLVVGPHAGDAFRGDMLAFDEERGLGRFADQQPNAVAPPGGGPGGTVNPTMRGNLPVGTQITFDGQGGPQWWDRNQWLMETRGITPDQESQIVGFWNANRGNQGITPEGVFAWYDQMGIPRPSEQEVMQGVQYARAGSVEFGAFDDSDAKAARAAQLQGMVQQDSAVRNFGAEYDPNSARSYLDTLTEAPLAGFADELSGLSGAIVGGLSGENPVTAYRDARDASQFRDEMNRDAQGIPGEALRLVGSLPTAMSLPGAYSPTVGGAVKAGASYGALAGAGEGRGLEGTIKGAAGGAALGGAVGGATAGAGQWAVNKLAARAEGRALQPVTDGQEVIAAAGRLNEQFGTKIKPIPGMVGGDGTRSITAPWRKATIGGTLINRGINKVADQAEKARNSIRAIFGEAMEPEQAGEAVIGSLQNWLKTSKNRPQALFKQAEREAGDTAVDFANARAVADELIAQAQKTPGGVAGLDDLIELRAALDSPSDVVAARAMRTEQKAKVKGKNLQYTPAEARILQVMDAADDDIVTSLRQAGKDDVAEKFGQAAQEWRERSLTIDEVVVPILGRRNDLPKSGEEVIAAIEQAAKRKSARLGKLMSILPEDDANALRATVLDRIGKAAPGQQTGAMADDFSTETFLTQWNGMSDRAKTAMFGGELRAALDDVATVAGAVRKVGKAGNNPSGQSILAAASGATLTAGLAFSNPLFFVFNAIDGLGGAVLASPRFARWMAKMPKEPGKARMHLEGLRKVAAAESGPISAELNSLYGTLAGQFDNLKGSAQPSFAQPGQDQDRARNTAKPTTMPVPK